MSLSVWHTVLKRTEISASSSVALPCKRAFLCSCLTSRIWVVVDMIIAAQEYEIEKLQKKAKEAQAWCDSVALTAETEDYRKKTLDLQKLMHKLGLK